MPNVDEGMNLLVEFDSGAKVTLDVRQRDLVKLEELDPAYGMTQAFTVRTGFLLAYVVLQRMGRLGQLPADVTVPDTFEAFCDVVDVGEPPAPPKASRGKARRPAAQAGS